VSETKTGIEKKKRGSGLRRKVGKVFKSLGVAGGNGGRIEGKKNHVRVVGLILFCFSHKERRRRERGEQGAKRKTLKEGRPVFC